MEYAFQKTVSADKFDEELRLACPHYLGFRSEGDSSGQMTIVVLTDQELSVGEEMVLNQIVSDHDPFDVTLAVRASIRKSIIGAQDIVEQFATENVLMGITEAGKTKLIADAVSPVMYYLQTGAVTVAIEELQAIQIDETMAPFLTEVRRSQYVEKLQQLLASL